MKYFVPYMNAFSYIRFLQIAEIFMIGQVVAFKGEVVDVAQVGCGRGENVQRILRTLNGFDDASGAVMLEGFSIKRLKLLLSKKK